MRRIDRYRAEIRRQFDWDRLKAEATANPVDMEGADDPVGLVFIGTVFSLTPSGKFYAPHATSNLEACPRCKGTGGVRNRHGDQELYDVYLAGVQQDRLDMIQEYGPWSDGKWPPHLTEKIRRRQKVVDGLKPELECSWCGGTGSHEAAMDQDWNDALNTVAEEHGMFATTGEGDPCDVFVGVLLEA